MELNTIHRLRRTGQAVRTQTVKTDVPEAAASSGTKSRTDSIDLSERAVAQLREQSQRIMNLLQQQEQEQEAKKLPSLWEMAEAGEKPESDMLDAMGEKMKVMQRCQKIAARIMRGDKVPPEDERYLMENDLNGYKMALALRTPKRKPKEWKSVLKEEEKRTEEDDSEEAAQETSSCQTSEGASDSGGGATADSE